MGPSKLRQEVSSLRRPIRSPVAKVVILHLKLAIQLGAVGCIWRLVEVAQSTSR